MDERPHSGAGAEDWKHAFTHHLDDLTTGPNLRARSIKRSVPQCDSFQIPRGDDHRLQLANRSQCSRHGFRPIGVQRIVFCFYRPTFTRVRPTGETLGDETACTGSLGCFQQELRAFCPKTVSEREFFVQFLEIAEVR